MTISLESIPRLTAAQALQVAERDYGIVGDAVALPSERDQNFLITDSQGARFVLKIANSSDGAELLDFQNQAMRRVARTLQGYRVPQVIQTREGADLAAVRNDLAARDYGVRVLSWIDGDILAKSPVRGPELFQSIGAGMAKIDRALCDFTHPAMRRASQWDVRRADLAREHLNLLPSERRSRVERAFEQWRQIDWSGLRHGVIHGDANDYNVIVEAGRMVGLLDFGDLVYSATVCDLAIALAYTLLDEKEPLSVAAHIIGAYQRYNPLSDAEQRALLPLVESRLAMSVCYSAHNRARNPRDPYQVVTEASAWTLLNTLDRWSADDALQLVRSACTAGAAHAGESTAE